MTPAFDTHFGLYSSVGSFSEPGRHSLSFCLSRSVRTPDWSETSSVRTTKWREISKDEDWGRDTGVNTR